MKWAVSTFSSGYWVAVSILLLAIAQNGDTQNYKEDGLTRSIYLGTGLHGKGGWRPIISSGLAGITTYNIAGPPAGIAQKIMTGPAIVETKVLSPHILGVTSELFGSGMISTSTRPIVTRDTNKLSGIHGYKTSIYPQNLNAPVNSYLNPFVFTSNANLNSYKFPPGYQFESNIFLRQPVSHRPVYTKSPQQMLVGKRIKHNQFMQHLTNNQYHQTLQSYQNNLKKPVDSYQRPLDPYPRPIDSHVKPHAYDLQGNNNIKFNVNPQDSLSKQTQNKPHTGQGVAAITYKPPLGSHFQQFGLKEESFAPIPPSILGSFTSFGHASIKAREPTGNKNGYLPTSPTKAPYTPTSSYEFTVASTDNTEIKVASSNLKASSSQNINIGTNIKDDYSKNLIPPPKTQNQFETIHVTNYSVKNVTSENRNPSTKHNFIPSPIDPLSKFENNLDASKFPITKVKQPEITFNSNSPTRRPTAASYFDSNLISPSTANPFEAHSTNVVPENLLVQLPPPFTSYNTYNGQSVKTENSFGKNKFQTFTAINHNGVTSKFNVFDDIKYFPPRGPEYFDTKFNKNRYQNKEKPYQHSYEVTENWEPSGESATQPTLHSWVNQPNTFKQYNTILGPPKIPLNIKSTYFPGTIPPRVPDYDAYNDVSTVYSIIPEHNRNKDLINQLENTISSSVAPQIQDSNPSNEEIVISPTSIDDDSDKIKISVTEGYSEITTVQQNFNSRRRPSKFRTHQETSSISNLEDFTTRFETFKEHAQETENDLQASDLPTIPPNKHFRRPELTTSPSLEEDKPKRRNKNRRRRPIRPSSTTEDSSLKEVTTFTTEQPSRTRYRTTTIQPETEDTTKISRPRLRFPPPKARPTKPSHQPELTSSAQPTMIPTHPVTMRTKLHSRIRTTLPSLDFDDLFETTTIRDTKVSETNQQQSSIMKIAKENHAHRSSNNKYSVRYGGYNETPDYSHKQDEKDTPTSDISVNTYDSMQKSRNDSLNEDDSKQSMDFTNFDSEPQHTAPESYVNPTVPSYLNEKDDQVTQPARNEQTFVNIRHDQNKEHETVPPTGEADVTTVTTADEKPNRYKSKTNKYDNNRPRFSVKDYRNRLNSYSSTSTEKPSQSSEPSTRIRFPNRSRYPSVKDSTDKQQNSTVEQSHKKGSDDENNEEKLDTNLISSRRLPSTQKRTNSSADNEVVPKIHKFRSNLRRDPNRKRSTTTEAPSETNEKPPQKHTVHSNFKRPSLNNFRKRVQNKNMTIDTIESNATEAVPILESESIFPVYEIENQTSTEKSTSETAIMKIAKDERKHIANEVNIGNTAMDASQRVSDLTLAASKDYNTPGLFKSVSPNSRRVVPNYFTIATDDPILPIEAFFPQLNQKKET